MCVYNKVSGLLCLKILPSPLIDSLGIELLSENNFSLEFFKCCFIDFKLAILHWRIGAILIFVNLYVTFFPLAKFLGYFLILMCQYFSPFTFFLFFLFFWNYWESDVEYPVFVFYQLFFAIYPLNVWGEFLDILLFFLNSCYIFILSGLLLFHAVSLIFILTSPGIVIIGFFQVFQILLIFFLFIFSVFVLISHVWNFLQILVIHSCLFIYKTEKG